MTNDPLVFIIILNWNGWRDTVACVESCTSLTWPNYRLLVVDNGSTDGSEAAIREQHPAVELIQTGANLGFAGGNNVGIRHAVANGAEYVWLLNNDTVVHPEALTRLVEALRHDPTAAIAGSKIYYHDEPRKIWFAGGLWEKGRLRLRQRGANEADAGQFDEPCRVGSVSGCSMLVRSAAIAQMGLMDERYFLYWEDTDWCARGRECGLAIIFVPASHVWHKISASTGNNSFSQYYYSTRNGLYFLRRYDPLFVPLFAARNLVFGLKCLAAGNLLVLRGVLRGVVDFLRQKRGPAS